MKRPCSILIVDDELLIRQGLINYLDWESEGFSIVGGASNGKEALEMIEKVKPHIIITDVVMPVMDGIELVKKVKEKYSDIEIIVLSSFEDYEYVRSTFQSGVADYILKPKLNGKELLRTLKQVKTNISGSQKFGLPSDSDYSIEQIIERMIMGQEIDGYENEIDLEIPYKNFVLLQIKSEYGATTYLQKVMGELEESFPNAKLVILELEESDPIILLNYYTKNSKQIEQMLKELPSIRSEMNEINPKFNVLLSETFNSIYEINKIYHEDLLKLENYLFYLPNYLMMTQNNLPKLAKTEKKFDLNHFTKIFKTKQFNTAFNYVAEYIHYLSTQYHHDRYEFKSFIGNVIFNIIVLLDNLHFNTETLEDKKYSYFSSVNKATTAKKTIEIYQHFIYEVNEIIFTYNREHQQSEIQRMLLYIEENYAEPLSLTKVADHFHFNSSYLSSYFSTHHNEGFNEYLNRVRIKKAMELLKNNSLSISDISWMVGYSSHSYFCKVFKKITGMSPSEFRRGHSIQHE